MEGVKKSETFADVIYGSPIIESIESHSNLTYLVGGQEVEDVEGPLVGGLVRHAGLLQEVRLDVAAGHPGGSCIEIGLPGKSIIRDYFQESHVLVYWVLMTMIWDVPPLRMRSTETSTTFKIFDYLGKYIRARGAPEGRVQLQSNQLNSKSS